MTRPRVRRLVILVAALGLMLPAAAHSEYFQFYDGDIAPGGYRGTAQAQQR